MGMGCLTYALPLCSYRGTYSQALVSIVAIKPTSSSQREYKWSECKYNCVLIYVNCTGCISDSIWRVNRNSYVNNWCKICIALPLGDPIVARPTSRNVCSDYSYSSESTVSFTQRPFVPAWLDYGYLVWDH